MLCRSRVSGIITFDPVPWSAISESRFLPDAMPDDVVLILQEDEVHHPDGILLRRSAVGIKPVWRDEYKAHDLMKELQELTAELNAWVDEYQGYLHIDDEEAGGVWRLYVKPSGEVIKALPEVTWPDAP